jgi:hypothetical protein
MPFRTFKQEDAHAMDIGHRNCGHTNFIVVIHHAISSAV